MKASIADLRYHMNHILRALERDEDVYILNRGKLKAVIRPADDKRRIKVQDHPLFGMLRSSETVNRRMEKLREGRYAADFHGCE